DGLVPSPAVLPASARPLRRRASAAARSAHRARARGRVRAARSVPRAGLDDRDRSGLDAGGGAGNADAALARSGAAARRGGPRARALSGRPGGTRPRERTPLPAAEAIHGHHAEVAAAAGVPEDRGAR